MNYNEIYKKSFAALTPQTDSEMLYKIAKEHSIKTDTRKRLRAGKVAAIAVAAVLGTVTISVGAATGWDFNGAFNALFRSRVDSPKISEEYAVLELAGMTPLDFSSCGKQLDITEGYDECTVSVRGIAADNSMAYVIYDITLAEERTALPQWAAQRSSGNIFAGGERISPTNMHGFIRQQGEVYTFYSAAQTYLDTSIEGCVFRLDLGGVFKADIPIDFDVSDSYRVFELNQQLNLKRETYFYERFEEENNMEEYQRQSEITVCPATITEARVSPFSFSYTYLHDGSDIVLSEDGCSNHRHDIRMSISLRNGTVINSENFTASGMTIEDGDKVTRIMNFEMPINPDDVTAVSFEDFNAEDNSQ